MKVPRRHRRAFSAAARALLAPAENGSPFEQSGADELGVTTRLEEALTALPPRGRKEFRQLLGLMSNPAGGLILYGKPRAFAALPVSEAESALRRMASSRIGTVRTAFQALKRLVGSLAVNPPEGETTTLAWQAIRYPGPLGAPPDVPKPLVMTEVKSDTTLDCDVAVVGSGAGGGVAAAVLAEAGLDVIVLEKGAYRNESDFTHYESQGYRDLYLDGGQSGTTDLGISMLAGATLGGGTVVNYTTSFATPPGLREEWDKVAGFAGVFAGEEFELSSQSVHNRLGVNKDHNEPSSRELLMEKGFRALGWHVESMPRNVSGCTTRECGYCILGCRIGAKQSMLLTWLADAQQSGARIVVGANVRRVFGDSHAQGVEAEVGQHRLRVNARAVVLAAGALHTPAILTRSDMGGPAVGKYLRLHPATGMWGRFADRVEPWTGIMQALYSDQFENLDGKGYGVKFETAPVHPLWSALLFPWDSGPQWKELVASLGDMSVVGVITRDRSAGRVITGKDGEPRWKYALSKADQAHTRKGFEAATRALAEAGAREVFAPTGRPLIWNPAGSESIDAFMRRYDSIGYGGNQTIYGSWHQMGSARMGHDPKTAVVDDVNQVHTTPGLYVLDSSTFPTSSGVNPMITVETIAHRGARALAHSLS
ncbi:MAG: GMC family oxidoreductase [Acidimicrobiia bacterium]|nr:GMC family oxidoreductase [Acidimicrobiia bacterium]